MIIPLLLFFAIAGVFVPSPLSAETASSSPRIQNPATIGAYVEKYYSEDPILAKIAQCESHMQQFDKKGRVYRGTINHSDIGVMQINAYYHEKKATKLGMDIYTFAGNLAYAQYLYDSEGTTPWASSEMCWGKTAFKTSK